MSMWMRYCCKKIQHHHHDNIWDTSFFNVMCDRSAILQYLRYNASDFNIIFFGGDTLNGKICFLIIKIIDFRGHLPDILAKTATLLRHLNRLLAKHTGEYVHVKFKVDEKKIWQWS